MDDLTYSGYLGLGVNTTVPLTFFDGMQVSNLPGKGRTYEYLYLIKDGKKIVTISQFYHRNYDELKNAIFDRVKFLGKIEYSYIQDFREIFS